MEGAYKSSSQLCRDSRRFRKEACLFPAQRSSRRQTVSKRCSRLCMSEAGVVVVLLRDVLNGDTPCGRCVDCSVGLDRRRPSHRPTSPSHGFAVFGLCPHDESVGVDFVSLRTSVDNPRVCDKKDRFDPSGQTRRLRLSHPTSTSPASPCRSSSANLASRRTRTSLP